ncbi:MAG: response regulator [Treponema sp.]|nr:response regulator [Treponema sp.]
MQNSKKQKVRFVLVFLVALGLSLLVSNAIMESVDKYKRDNSVYLTDNIQGGLNSVYSHYLITAKSLSGYVQNRRGNYAGIEDVSKNYIMNVYGVSCVHLVKDDKVILTMSPDDNAFGYDVLSQEAKKDDALVSRNLRMPVISGPYDVKGTGGCLLLRTPIFMGGGPYGGGGPYEGMDGGPDAGGGVGSAGGPYEGMAGSPYEGGTAGSAGDMAGGGGESPTDFWGFCNIIIDMDRFFSSSGLKRLNNLGYSYQLWIKGKADSIVCDGIIGDFDSPVRRDFQLGNKDWVLYLEPAEGWVGKGTVSMYIAVSFLVSLIVAMLDSLGSHIIRSNKVLKKQTRLLHESEENERNLRNIYEASVESAELFLWELNLRDGSARLIGNPYTKKVSEIYGIPKEIPNLIQFIRAHCLEEDYKVLDDIFSAVRRGEDNVDAVVHFQAEPDAEVHTLRVSYFIVRDEYGRAIKGYGTAQDFTEDIVRRDGYNQELGFFSSYQGKDMVLRVRADLTIDEVLETAPRTPAFIGANYTELTKNGEGMDFEMAEGKAAREVLDRSNLLHLFAIGERSFTYEYRIGSIGSRFSWLRGVVKLWEAPDNKHVELFFYVYDISNQKNEQQLIGSIINSVYEKIGIIDLPEGKFRNFMVNKESVSDSGMPYDEYMLYSVASNYIPESDQAVFRDAMKLETVRRELDSSGLYSFQTPYLEMGEGGGVRKAYKMIRFCYLDDSHAGIIVCVSDVTRQNEKEMEQRQILREALDKAESANRAKSEFVSRISHDIRTPIGAIQNLTQFAKNDADDKEKLFHDLDQIETSNKFLLSLINDVLDISKVDKGQIKLTPEVYPYEEYIDGIRNIIGPMCANKGLHWQLDNVPEGFGGAVIVDRVRLNQIALNLLSNAVKYTPECGDVSYTSKSRKLGDGKFLLAFEVRDTGIGMSEEFQKHMFEEFSQEYDNTQRPKGITGTGLGLAIVKRMVDLMGGKLTVESQIGIGTRVNVEIPCEFRSDEQIMQSQKKDLELEKKDENASVKLAGKVLLAEDNPINTDIAMTILDIFGCKVDHAENGKEAVELFAFSKPGEYSVILMDIQMPFMDGYEATRRIRALKRDDAKTIPIIAMTADAFEDARQRAYDAGVDDYLTKPLNPKELKRRLLDIS